MKLSEAMDKYFETKNGPKKDVKTRARKAKPSDVKAGAKFTVESSGEVKIGEVKIPEWKATSLPKLGMWRADLQVEVQEKSKPDDMGFREWLSGKDQPKVDAGKWFYKQTESVFGTPVIGPFTRYEIDDVKARIRFEVSKNKRDVNLFFRWLFAVEYADPDYMKLLLENPTLFTRISLMHIVEGVLAKISIPGYRERGKRFQELVFTALVEIQLDIQKQPRLCIDYLADGCWYEWTTSRQPYLQINFKN